MLAKFTLVNLFVVGNAMLRGHVDGTWNQDGEAQRGLQMNSAVAMASGGASALNGMVSNQGMMVTTDPSRTDGVGGGDPIIVVPPPTPAQPIGVRPPTQPAGGPPTSPPPTGGPGTIWTCPSAVSSFYQNMDGVRACRTNADCEGFNTLDGPTCCLSPTCTCQNPNPGASKTMGCVTDTPPDRTDGSNGNDPVIPIGTSPRPTPMTTTQTVSRQPTPRPSPTIIVASRQPTPRPSVVVSASRQPTPLPTRQPTPRPSPITPPSTRQPTPRPTPFPTRSGARTCPSTVSQNYQNLNGVRACTKNSDCEGYETFDGPTCCLFPTCTCENPNPGASQFGCTTD